MRSPTTFAHFLRKLPSPIYKVLAQRWYDDKYPRHLFIELTSNCNLSCSYCPRPRISRELPYGLFKKIVDEASLYGHRSFSLHLFGEPLLYPRIIESIRYLKRRGHTVILTTNGLLLGKFWRDLKDVDKIIWSYKEKVEIPEEIKGWKNFTVRFFGRVVGKWKNTEVRGFHNYGGSLPLGVQSTDRFPCYHPWFAPAVNSNGDILICCADPLGKSAVGNVRNLSIAEAWARMKTWRSEHLKGIFREPCTHCNTYLEYPNIWFSSQYSTSPSSGSSTQAGDSAQAK